MDKVHSNDNSNTCRRNKPNRFRFETKVEVDDFNLVKELTDELKESDIAFLTHKIESGHPIEVCKQW